MTVAQSNLIKFFFLVGCWMLGLGFCSNAQDTTKRKTINITSTFKPVLKNASKINFNAAEPPADTSKPRLTYNIPSQYLFLSYLPAALKPAALHEDSLAAWENYDYIKLGVGNVHQPFIQTGFSFGDRKNTFLNIYANQYSSKGSLPFQKSSLTDVALVAGLKTQNKLEWNGRLGFKSDGYYLYGYRPDTLKFTKEQLLQRFQTFEGNLSLRNTEPTAYGLNYKPNIQVSVFSDNHIPKATEANTVLNLPLQKLINKSFSFNLGFTADLTNYRRENDPPVQNNLFYVSPVLFFKTPNFYLQAGLTPSWDNRAFTLLPNFMADVSTGDQRFTLQFGWIGYYDKGNYQKFESINPWLQQPLVLLNTRVQERYAGFKGSLNNHINYSAKAGFLEFHNMPLFVNDSLDGKTFNIRYEPDLQAFQIHGEIAYTQGEQFSISALLNINNYAGLQKEIKAWGLLPLEFKSTLRWQIVKELWIKSDLWAFTGPPFRGNNGQDYKGTGGFDLNAGIEFRVARQLNLWLQMNNLLNDQYERWNQYKSYGFNILGGIIFSFGQK